MRSLPSAPANGENAHHVDYGSGEKKIGEFFQTGPKEWAERNTEQGKIIYTFKETGRDEWSVYLKDATRNASLQLDLWTRKVYYSDPNTPRREQYTVVGAA